MKNRTKEERRAFWDEIHQRIGKEAGVDFKTVELIRSRLIRNSNLTLEKLIKIREEQINSLDKSVVNLQRIIRKWESFIAKGEEALAKGKNNSVVRYAEKARVKKQNNMKNHEALIAKKEELLKVIEILKGITEDKLKIILQEVKI